MKPQSMFPETVNATDLKVYIKTRGLVYEMHARNRGVP